MREGGVGFGQVDCQIGRRLQVGSPPLGQTVYAASRGRRSEGCKWSSGVSTPLDRRGAGGRKLRKQGGVFHKERGLSYQQDPGRQKEASSWYWLARTLVSDFNVRINVTWLRASGPDGDSQRRHGSERLDVDWRWVAWLLEWSSSQFSRAWSFFLEPCKRYEKQSRRRSWDRHMQSRQNRGSC